MSKAHTSASPHTLFKAQNASPEMGNAASKLAAKTAAAGGGGGVNGGSKPCTNLFVPPTQIVHCPTNYDLPQYKNAKAGLRGDDMKNSVQSKRAKGTRHCEPHELRSRYPAGRSPNYNLQNISVSQQKKAPTPKPGLDSLQMIQSRGNPTKLTCQQTKF